MKKALFAVGGLALVVTVSARPAPWHASPTGSDTLFSNAQELARAASTKIEGAKSTRFAFTETIGNIGTIVARGEGRFGADAAVISLLPAEELQKLVGRVKTIPMELWLNQDSLPVQITEDLTEIVKESGETADEMPMTTMLKYTAWGTPVDIQDPPADQVARLTPITN